MERFTSFSALAGLLAGGSSLLFTAAASADPVPSQPPLAAPQTPPAAPQTPPAAVVEMPRPLTPLTAAYPPGAKGDAVVIVKLVVEKDGSVASAELAEGKEPFASAALAAARLFRFAPATRDGTPIRAAIRAEVTFKAPRATPENSHSPDTSAPDSNSLNNNSPDNNSPNSNSPGAPGSPPPGSDAPIDVSVRGIVAPPGATTMSRAEVRLLPGAFGDPFRAIETLPGVTPIASGLPYFFVRGAPPGNVGYFLDGIRVPLLYHLGLGPSVVHPAIVDRVDLHPGGFPAAYGRFAGGIVAGETRAPRPDINGEAVIRLVDAGAMLEVPFDGGRGTALAGGRYSYTGLLFSILQSNIRLDYWDYQARVSYDLTPRDTVMLFAFGARDFLGDTQDDKPRTLVDTTFHRVDLRHDRKLGPGSAHRAAVTFGFEETGFQDGGAKDLLFGARSELKLAVSPTLTLRGGADATVDIVDTSLALTEFGGSIPIKLSTRHDFSGSAWADVVWAPDERFEMTPGLRLGFFGSTGKEGATAFSIEPRVSALLRLKPWLRLVQAYGLVAQRPSFFLPGPGFSPDFDRGLLQRSLQGSAGVEADLPLDMEAKVTLFRNAFFDMTDAFGTSTFTDLITPEAFGDRSLGSAIGVELSLRRRMTKRVGGFLSYTLSRSERMMGAYHFLSGTNRTHVLNLAANVNIGRGFSAGARGLFYTGFPEIVRGSEPGSPKIDTGRELPPFFRLDARAEKRWSLGRTRWLSLVLEMQNTTLSTETLGIRCERTCEPIVIGPVAIPSIGLEGGL